VAGAGLMARRDRHDFADTPERNPWRETMSCQIHGARPVVALLSLVVFATAATSLPAAEPVVQGDVTAGAAPGLVQKGDDARIAPAMPAAPGAPAPVRPLSPDDEALRQILSEGQARVAALLAEGQGVDGARMQQVQKEIVKVKTETRIRFLQAKLELARRDGDEPELAAAQQALELTLNPPAPAPVPSDRAEKDPKAREVSR
jgi:hypothetical protein